MKVALGVMMNPVHTSPEEWAEKILSLGLRAVVLPCDCRTKDSVTESYLRVCHAYDLIIAEVGAWCNPLSADSAERTKNIARCRDQLQFADYIGARCCVNILGSEGAETWDGPHIGNLAEDAVKRAAESVHTILDGLQLKKTYYTLEPMPWMVPDSPEQYAALLDAVAHPRFAVHMDIVNMIYSPRDYFFNRAFIDRAFDLLKGRIRSCHVKDIKLANQLTLHLSEVPCGEGVLDIRHYAQRAFQEDTDMPFLIEHLSEWDAYLSAINTVKKILAEE